MNIEREHRGVTHGDAVMTARIAMDHLNERADYYELLERVEKAPRRRNPVLAETQVRLVGPDTLAYEQIDTSTRGRSGPLPTARGTQALVYWPGDGRAMVTLSQAVFVKRGCHWRFDRAVRVRRGDIHLAGGDFALSLDRVPTKAEAKVLHDLMAFVGGAKALRSKLPARLTRHP